LKENILNTIKQIYPPRLLAMVLYVQLLAVFLNYSIYDSRELLILFCWIPLLTFPYFITGNRILYVMVVLVFFVEGFISLSHFLLIKGPLTASSLFVMVNTNLNEAKEFLELKAGLRLLLLLPYFFLFSLAMRKQITTGKTVKLKWVLAVVLIISLVFLSENLIKGRFVRKAVPQTVEAFISFNEELSSYKKLQKREVEKVDVKTTFNSSEKNVFVLIIGESCNRNHMSLYDYSRKTTPKLDSRNDILVYRNVVSGYSNTLSAVLSMLTESNLENKKSIDKSISLIDVFHSAGFKTYWLSNQSPIGVWDNGVYNLARTSDVSYFINNYGNSSFESTYLQSYDEKLIDPLMRVLKDKQNNKFIVLHLMGSHSTYSKRYPSSFGKFDQSSSDKERIINEYDNSILYNDFVVDSIFSILNSCSKTDPLLNLSCIYLSDHGENVYDENGNVGHDYAGSLPKANVEIPFVVWFSESIKKKDPEKYKTMAGGITLPFVTDDLFHAVADLNRIELKSTEKARSLFHASFNLKRIRILEDNLDYDSKR
jgi:heptose-I-phosphate ethanolaminephosphotransferase